MTIESALRAHLLADSNISNEISTRMFPLRLPQNTEFTAITYQVISGDSTYTQDGDSGLDRPRIQIDVWDPSYEKSVEVGNLVKDRLSGFKGTVSGIEIQGIFRDSWRDLDDVLADGITKLYRRSQDFFVHHVD